MGYNVTMENKSGKKRIDCPGRWGVLLLSLLWVGFYFAFRQREEWMDAICRSLVRPCHRVLGRAADRLPFSLAECLGWAGGLLALLALLRLILLLRRPRDRRALGRWALTVGSVGALLFALFCLLWGVYYYAPSFAEQSGLEPRPVSAEELEEVTRYFVSLCNDYAQRVPRDEEGLYAGDEAVIFSHAPALYRAASRRFPCLRGEELHVKSIRASWILSYVNCTGFFCPYTAEANVNTHMPPTLLPATIAHELAHQRGVAAEDEANFVAVLAALEDGQEDYVYSAAVMAYIYLGNALYKADTERWAAVYGQLGEEVRRDLRARNAYWERYDQPVKEASDRVYTAFLRTYGDDRGLQSYGACVDLLVAYYGETAGKLEN